MVSELFDANRWKEVEGFDFTDITYHRAVDQGTVRIAFNRPEVLNAFRPHTVDELYRALDHARFKQTDADVASFDGGFGSAYLARQVGQKFAREIFFLGETYSAEDAHRMGMVNAVVPHEELESTALEWAAKINGKSPTAQRMLKFAFNLVDDGLMGQQVFAGEATRLAYMTDEAVEGRDAFLEKRRPDWSAFPWYY
jgi:naphthoate synthase